MLYVGHFSFDSREEVVGGTFTCLVEAASVDEAVEKFRALVISHSGSFVKLKSAGGVFADIIIEVKELPKQGVLTQLEEYLADGSGSFSTTLPSVPPEFCESYRWPLEGQSDEEEHEVEPFLTFEETEER